MKAITSITVALILALALIFGAGCDLLESEEELAAKFVANHISGSNPLTVTFANKSTGKYEECYWQFGDGGSSNSHNPSHTYNSPGKYTVKLTVSGADGTDSETKSDYIMVYQDRSARFTDYDIVWNNPQRLVWIEVDLEINGFAGERFTIGGYWFRKKQDGKFYYVKSACQTNIPGDLLGHQFNITASSNAARFTNLQCAVTNYSCFSDRTGTYYGMVKLYKTASIGIDPNSSTIITAGYVSFSWTKSSKSDTEDAHLEVRLLNETESCLLDNEIQAQGGILMPGL